MQTTASQKEKKLKTLLATVLGLALLFLCLLPSADCSSMSSGGIMRLVPFEASAFPYEGEIPDENKPFLDVVSGERRGHTSPRGGVLWLDQTYSDRRVLLYVPKSFDSKRPAVIVVYFHGNLATLDRDVGGRQQVPQQLLESGLNAVLVAPQLAVDALDSSAGHFWDKDFFARFLDEAAVHLGKMKGISSDIFRNLPVVIVAYSGGYLPAIFAARIGGIGQRLYGIVLLDALFGEVDKYADWIGGNWRNTFFFSAYTRFSEEQNAQLRSLLETDGIGTQQGLPTRLAPGTISFLGADESVTHEDFVTRAWVTNPLQVVLAHIRDYRHTAAITPSPPREEKPR